MKSKIALLMVALGVIALVGCAGMPDLKLPAFQKEPLAKILVYVGEVPLGESGRSADGTELNVGGSVIFTAQGRDASGNPIAISPTWTTNKPDVISITPSIGPNVTVKGLAEGSPEIVVEADGVKKKLEYLYVR